MVDIAKRLTHRIVAPALRGFDPLYPPHDSLAQSVEHLTFNQGVRSSNLRWITIKKSAVYTADFFKTSFLTSFIFYMRMWRNWQTHQT